MQHRPFSSGSGIFLGERMRFITRLVIEAVKVVGKLTGRLTRYQPIAEVGIAVSEKRTRRTEKNLAYILNHFTDNSATVMDIGSNLGFYALRLGQRGMKCTGIEHNPVDWFMSWSCLAARTADQNRSRRRFR